MEVTSGKRSQWRAFYFSLIRTKGNQVRIPVIPFSVYSCPSQKLDEFLAIKIMFLSFRNQILLNLESTTFQSVFRNEKGGDIVKLQKSRLQEFKQISVETFTLLKQKLQDAKKMNVEKPKPGIYPY